jgi:hypothetical protein
MTFTRLIVGCALVSGALSAVGSLRSAEPVDRRWVYLQMNLQVAENVDRAEGILRRAAAAGYNGVVLADYKLHILDRVPRHYFEHARRFRALADELRLEIIPTVAPMGYSEGLLAHDPNLAEGLPVLNAPFVIEGREARLASAMRDPLPGGGFEQHRQHVVPGWDFQDAAGKASFVDTAVKHAGQSSLRWEHPGRNASDSSGNARVARKVAVSPWRQYHASVWIKTQDYEAAGNVRLFAMGSDGRALSHANLGVERTQDWKQHHIVFNSLGNHEVRIYCGTWSGRGGVLWMDDLQLEETAFVNLLRRDGCPLTVADETGMVYDEGRDYERLEDPLLGRVPWDGHFDVYHAPPRLKLTAGSRLRNGQRLRISFSHAVTIYDNQITCCLGHPKVFAILEDQIRRVMDVFGPKTYFLSHDEIRVANWCGSCRREGRSAGQLLAENVRQCAAVVRRIQPGAQLCIWSDMFDPHHNARDNYYLVNGDLAGSWEGLPPDVAIVNWNHGKAAESLTFFAARGHEQILAGFYDHDPQRIAAWLKTAADVRTRVSAGRHGRHVMYTTWTGDFSQLEAFAKAAWGTP